MQQQSRGHVAIGRLFLDQCSGRENDRLPHLLRRHSVVQILQCGLEYQRSAHRFVQPCASRLDQRQQTNRIKGDSISTLHHMQDTGRHLCRNRSLLPCSLSGPLLSVEHIGPRHIVIARSHQSELHLVLDILNMEGPTFWLMPYQRVDHIIGQLTDHLPHSG